LVSSCDAYADCWPPFFKLLATQWSSPVPPVYLNTETRAYTFPGLDIRCPRVGLTESRELAWSDRLRRCLDRIPYEIVLYLQEDYFIDAPVDVETIESLVTLMDQETLTHVSLMRGRRSVSPAPYPGLSRLDQRTQYRISAQAGLWRRSGLRSYLRRHESVWEFEWYGTERARRKRDTLLCISDEYEQTHGTKVISYHATGIANGRWARPVVDLFAAHEIKIDYAVRGFYDPADHVADRGPLVRRATRRLRSLL
jgi:hypothetical protein